MGRVLRNALHSNAREPLSRETPQCYYCVTNLKRCNHATTAIVSRDAAIMASLLFLDDLSYYSPALQNKGI